MRNISLQEFKTLSGFSDEALVWLLCHNQLPISLSEGTGILIDIESIQYLELIKKISSRLDERLKADETLNVERFAAIIKPKLSKIISEALKQIQI